MAVAGVAPKEILADAAGKACVGQGGLGSSVSTRYLRTLQELSLAGNSAPASSRRAVFTGINCCEFLSCKFPAKFCKVCSYSWEEIRRGENFTGGRKTEVPRENAHNLNCSSLFRSPLSTEMEVSRCSNSTSKLRPRTAPGALAF